MGFSHLDKLFSLVHNVYDSQVVFRLLNSFSGQCHTGIESGPSDAMSFLRNLTYS